jgi:hypothetical protein
MTYKKLLIFAMLILMIFQVSLVSAVEHEENDAEIFGLEVEKLLSVGSGILASVLFIFTYMAYNRSGRNKLKFVAIAFLLFALKAFLIGSELVIEELPMVDTISVILDFVILLSFFYGVIKK